MKILKSALLLFLFLPIISLSQTKKSGSEGTRINKIEVYYFHYTARCETCRGVEAEAKKDIETLYPDLIKQGKMSFQALNLEDASGKAIAEKLHVSGQTLLIVEGTRRINITNEGFLYARPDPLKFKRIIKEKVDGLIKL